MKNFSPKKFKYIKIVPSPGGHTFGVLGNELLGLVARVLGGHQDLLDDETAHGMAHKDDRPAAHASRQQALQNILRPLVWNREYLCMVTVTTCVSQI